MKTAFVTGATGFLGTNLVKELTAQNWEVHILHRPTSDLTYLSGLDIHQHLGSLDDEESLVAAIPQGVDSLFHVAASTNFWSKHNDQQYRTNVIGTKNVVQAALSRGVKRFVHTSSIAAYGLHQEPVREDTPSNAPQSGINYFVTKYLAEQEVKAAAAKGLDAVILNPAHIVGPYDRHNWVQMFQNVYHGNLPGIPATWGSFSLASEVAKAHIKAAETGVKGENYLLGGVKASMLEFVNEIEAAMGKSLSKKTVPDWVLHAATYWYRFSALFHDREPILTPEKTKLITHNVLCDDSKALNAFNFRHIPLATIVAETWNWLDQEGIL